MKQIPLLINGDDCVFPLKDFKIWEKMSAMVGLFNSIGKTFYSEKFIEMNSLTYLRKGTKFQEVPFINWGLLRGMKRSAQFHNEDNEFIKYSNMGTNHHELFKGLDHLYEDLNRLYIIYNTERLYSPDLSGIQWFLPSWLGGLGLYPGPNPERNISEDQRRCAKIIANKYDSDLSPDKLGALETCNIHRLIEGYINSFFQEHLDSTSSETSDSFEELEDQYLKVRDLSQEYQNIYNQILELIWRNTPYLELFNGLDAINDGEDNNFRLNPDFVSKARRVFLRKLHKNGRVYQKAYIIMRTCSKEVKPLKWHKLWYIKPKRNVLATTKDYSIANLDYLYSHGLSLRPGQEEYYSR